MPHFVSADRQKKVIWRKAAFNPLKSEKFIFVYNAIGGEAFFD